MLEHMNGSPAPYRSKRIAAVTPSRWLLCCDGNRPVETRELPAVSPFSFPICKRDQGVDDAEDPASAIELSITKCMGCPEDISNASNRRPMTFKDHFSSESPNYAAVSAAIGANCLPFSQISFRSISWRGIVRPEWAGCGSVKRVFWSCDRNRCERGADPSATPNPRVEYRIAPQEKNDLEETSCDLISRASFALVRSPPLQ